VAAVVDQFGVPAHVRFSGRWWRLSSNSDTISGSCPSSG
jgi:hypothetical protein